MSIDDTQAISNGNFVAIVPPGSTKVEAKVDSGFATIAQRTDVVLAELVMDFHDTSNDLHFPAKRTKVILRGDVGFNAWAKAKMMYNGKEFVLCPVDQVVGFEVADD